MENATAHRFLIVVAAALAACGDGASSDVPEDTVVLLDTVGDSGPADTFVEGTDTDRPMDAVEDTSSGAGPALLLLGQTGIGEASAAAVDDFVIDLRTGDTFGVGGFALRGDLQPAVYLSLDGVALEPESFEVGEQQVTLDYRVVTGGRYVIDVQPHQGQGAGRFLVRTWCTGGPCADDPVALPDVTLRLLAINDLHGNLAPRDDDSGGVAWLASHAKALRAEVEHSVFVSAGDLVGGSPYLSGRFHDEPTVEAMNVAGLDINGVGNHEFDEGPDELKRLATGGCHPIDGCQDGTPFEGAAFEMLAANVNDATGATLFPPFAVRVYGGVPVGFIGLTLEGTPAVTLASQVESLEFNDEIGTVNALLPRLQAMGVETIVLVLHEGGTQSGGANDCDNFSGGARWIAQGLSDVVDILVTGHTHRTYNCWLGDKLVTSAGASGRWLTKIDMTLNATTRDVWVDDARNRFIDHGLAPDPEVAALVARYEALVAPELAAVVGDLASALTRGTDDTGQSTLGLAVADSQWWATANTAGAELAFMNSSGLRANLPAGPINFGDAFTVQPFGNSLVTLTLTGQQLLAVLDRQFAFGGFSVLQPSTTLRYKIATVGDGIEVLHSSVSVQSVPLDPSANYRVTVNNFLAENDPAFAAGTDRVTGGNDATAFVDYLAAKPSPYIVPVLDQVQFQ